MMGVMCDFTTAEVFTQIDSTAADCGVGELDDFLFLRTSFPPNELFAGRDGNYTEEYSTVWGSPHIDYGAGAVELDDLIFLRTSFRRTSYPPGEMETIYGGTCGLACQYAIDQ